MSERVFPSSPRLEGLILQALLQDEHAAAVLTATLTPDVFYLDPNRRIFEAAGQCMRRGIVSEIETVTEELVRRKHLDAVGADYLDRVVDGPPSPAWPHHARILRELAERRRIIQAAERIATVGYGNGEPIEEFRVQAEATLFQAMQRDQTGEILTPRDLVDSLDEEAAPFTLPTGLALLDEPVPVLAAGRLVVLAGRPGSGKTAFSCGLLERHALGMPPIPCLFFSCEQTRREIAERILALRTGHTLYDTKTTTLPVAAVDRLEHSSLYVCEAGAPSLGTLLGQIRMMHATHGIRLVVVDHLGKVVGGRKETRSLEVGDVVRALKAVAKDLKIVVLALCQLNRLVEARNTKCPQLSDLRESGEIEQEADSVMFLWTNEDTTHQVAELPMYLTLAKNRDGAPGKVKLLFDRPRLRFVEERQAVPAARN